MRARSSAVLEAKRTLAKRNYRKTKAYWSKVVVLCSMGALACGIGMGVVLVQYEAADPSKSIRLESKSPPVAAIVATVSSPKVNVSPAVAPSMPVPTPAPFPPAPKPMPAPLASVARSVVMPPVAALSQAMVSVKPPQAALGAATHPSNASADKQPNNKADGAIWESKPKAVANEAPASGLSRTPPQVPSSFKWLEIPMNGTVMVQVGEVVRAMKAGDKLPTGEVIQQISLDEKTVVLVGDKRVKLP